MKDYVLLLLGFTLLTSKISAARAADTNAPSPSIAKESRCFEMRTYYAAPGKFEALHARFRDHTCALFKKHGMEVVGFWIPTDPDKGADNTLIYILAHKSRESARKSWADFMNDPEWKKAFAASEVNGRLAARVESFFLAATDYSPIK